MVLAWFLPFFFFFPLAATMLLSSGQVWTLYGNFQAKVDKNNFRSFSRGLFYSCGNNGVLHKATVQSGALQGASCTHGDAQGTDGWAWKHPSRRRVGPGDPAGGQHVTAKNSPYLVSLIPSNCIKSRNANEEIENYPSSIIC